MLCLPSHTCLPAPPPPQGRADRSKRVIAFFSPRVAVGTISTQRAARLQGRAAPHTQITAGTATSRTHQAPRELCGLSSAWGGTGS